jgi:anti-sigma regulatory factor (Ser/Thr protein kinase)
MGNKADVRMSRRFSRDIPEIPRSRRFVSDVLEEHGTDVTDAILLVTSELMTNAVRHGAGEVELRVAVDGSIVRVEVLDDGHIHVKAPAKTPPPSSLGGRGLLLVREVSKRWGSGFDAAGRTMVWAEVPA